jgi:phosphomannomutase
MTSDLADVLERARAWRDADPDEATRRELDALMAAAEAGDAAAGADLDERFAGRLHFGTAGLRAALGAGPMRMNRLVVRQAAAGLARWLGPGHRVVIGFDARHLSDQFASDTARVLAAAGLVPSLFDRTCPTPTLAFAVRHFHADAGVMCTASHNPAGDNGYKVYLGDGAQIVPPVDTEIAAAIEQAAAGGAIDLVAEDAPDIGRLGPAVLEAYLAHVQAATGALDRPAVARAHSGLRIAYTPMHGVGGATALAALATAGFEQVDVVAEQFEPDPEFPTLAFPNPEEPGAMDRVAALARATGADLVLANDPDADRLAVMVAHPDGSDWVALTGDQIGALLADHVLSRTQGDDRLVVTTYVSSQLLSRQAQAAGVHYAEVATGFKWVVRPALDHPEWRFVFGYEEALGFSVDPGVRDKDGISAAVCFAQLVEAARLEGTTVWDRLDGLGRRFGEHVTRATSWRVDGLTGAARLADTMAGLRRHPPDVLGGAAVRAWRDLAEADDGHPPADALIVGLEDGTRVCLRPSGTEPKLKAYVEVVEPVEAGPDAARSARHRGRERAEDVVVALREGPLSALESDRT